MIARILSRYRSDTVRLDAAAVLRATLDDRLEAALIARRAGRSGRQASARRREVAKVQEQRARDPLMRELAR